jgi:hypothetical protein
LLCNLLCFSCRSLVLCSLLSFSTRLIPHCSHTTAFSGINSGQALLLISVVFA